MTREIVGQHPAIAMLLLWAIVAGIARYLPRPAPASLAKLPTGIALGSLVAFSAVVLWYTNLPAYFDPAEPTITAVSWVFLAGQPLYPGLDAAERYVHIYGPMLFICHALALAVLGASVTASKAVGGGAIAAALLISHRAFAGRAGTSAAVLATGLCVALYLAFGNATFWTRAEPLLLLCAALALASAASTTRRVTSALLLGLACGVAGNLKVTGPLYIAPIVVMMAARHGWPWLLSTGTVAAGVAVAPFLLSNVSFTHYVDYIRLAADNGVTMLRLKQNVEWSVFLTLPLAVAWWQSRDSVPARESRLPLLSLGVSVALVAIAGAKPGGGPYHLLPFVPLIAYQALTLTSSSSTTRGTTALLVSFWATALLIAVPRQMTFLETMANRPLASANADVRAIADNLEGARVAVGYAGSSYLSHARVEAVFRFGDYLLDGPAIQEHRLSGLPVPGATIEAIRTCREQYWLLPRGLEPFLVPNAYAPRGPRDVFPENFRAAFLESYEQRGRTSNFDVWACRRKR